MARVANIALTRYSGKISTLAGSQFCQLCCTRSCFVNRVYASANYHVSSVNSQRKRKKKQSKVESQLPSILSEEGEKALVEFQNPKSCLHNTLSMAVKDATGKYQYKLKQKAGDPVKQSVLRVTWPEEFTVVGLGTKRVVAEKMAAALACAKLKEFGLLDENNMPRIEGEITHDKAEIKEHFKKENGPEWVKLERNLEEEITQVLRAVKSQRESPALERTTTSSVDFTSESCFEFDDDTIETVDQLSDVITGKTYRELTPNRAQWKNNYLAERQLRLDSDTADDLGVVDVRAAALKLPIANKRKEILGLIRENQVIVLEGETGCGKTTQVPQYLLEEWIQEEKGAQCNIVCTQPRRISAVSVADRVSQERRETVGDTVGYQVRLDSKLPHNNGCILFCTTGILLKKMESNPGLKGISHVIVDEVHERDIDTDFLLILLKNLLQVNPDIKLILMSASINARLISSYFNDCPMISVPGFMYPVKEHFISERSHLTDPDISHSDNVVEGEAQAGDEEGFEPRPLTDIDLAVDVIKHIDENKPQGAILCFLPGWQDIRNVSDRLQETWRMSNKHLVLPVHSSVPLSSQQTIFESPGEGVRKVVLATNIAETSITINDVVYVVNPGNHKEDRYNVNLGVSCLDVHWISKANVRQRKGRAGRCQPGECFHLFTRERYQQFEDYQTPEMLRIPLEQIVVQSKLHFPHMRAADLLGQAIQPPPLPAVEKAVEVLQDLAILNNDESLTALGDKILGLSTEPRLAKALVLSAIYRCVNPMLTVAAGMHTRAPFVDSMENRAAILRVRRQFAEGSQSDHLAQVQLYEAWDQAMYSRDVRSFNDQNYIHHSTMIFIRGLRQQLAENLADAGLVTSSKDCLHGYDGSSDHAHNDQLIKGVLCGSFFPNLLRARQGKIEKGRMAFKKTVVKDIESNNVLLSRRSVNNTLKNLSSRWLTYFSKAKADQVFIHDTSTVHPLAVLCMTGRRVHVKPVSQREMLRLEEEDPGLDPNAEVVKLVVSADIHTTSGSYAERTPVTFYATYDTAVVLMGLIREVNTMVEECLNAKRIDDLPQEVKTRHEDVLEMLQKIVNSPQTPFMVTAASKKKKQNHRNNDWHTAMNMNLTARW
ncbi:ATP-dependent RNA helicase DHX30-like [Asterias rubens]|uniref:ATP-dependent RNA helicase DHX30-like n=1 Tax=Asterias rubens TaxID=7604 RepID=UPI0014551B71|nr:ATP-dependent RNA helicase DHX30-like [Asterias rubens]